MTQLERRFKIFTIILKEVGLLDIKIVFLTLENISNMLDDPTPENIAKADELLTGMEEAFLEDVKESMENQSE